MSHTSRQHTPTTVAPNITQPSVEYKQDQMLQLVNQLRIYFNQIDNVNSHQIEHAGGLTSLHWLGDN